MLDVSYTITEKKVFFYDTPQSEQKHPTFYKEIRNIISFCNKFVAESGKKVLSVDGSKNHGLLLVNFSGGETLELYNQNYSKEDLFFLARQIVYKAWSMHTKHNRTPDAIQQTLL